MHTWLVDPRQLRCPPRVPRGGQSPEAATLPFPQASVFSSPWAAFPQTEEQGPLFSQERGAQGAEPPLSVIRAVRPQHPGLSPVAPTRPCLDHLLSGMTL